ncbi:molybdopterin-guanine dinucleotide biosynthesis protein B [Stappia sp. MMSF_3263]|uniref:molybdopterin-guanine dinucleotide biosynthesis protein B n=1 Tax=Stappia sp. MMSF_3263 TaxID=3046693 RepID=UPI00273DDB34|nr:molybdopterin-guanine dinucleotide biosynthesis protein B [Stappia sp. MMSF_3263]
MSAAHKAPVFGIAGWKNSGKTTLTERLVAAISARGYRVATVKHAHHAFDVDQEGTDSHRHRVAGAVEVALVSSRRWALMHELRGAQEPSLGEILERLSPCDIVLVEGYKRAPHPKIELRRHSTLNAERLADDDPSVVAIASDEPAAETRLPAFDLDDVEGIADFVLATCGLRKVADDLV